MIRLNITVLAFLLQTNLFVLYADLIALSDLITHKLNSFTIYETVVDFLNNGFHYDDLKDVWDINLDLAFGSKWEDDPEDIFTLGMDYDEACTLIARLREKALTMDSPMRKVPGSNDVYFFDYQLVDYDAFQSEFPESMQAQINQNYDNFKEFIKNCAYLGYPHSPYGYYDGKNPFGTDQTKWAKLGKSELEVKIYHNYGDWDEDLYLNFPLVYEINNLGKYRYHDLVYLMGMYYTIIDGRYYFLDFHATILS